MMNPNNETNKLREQIFVNYVTKNLSKRTCYQSQDNLPQFVDNYKITVYKVCKSHCIKKPYKTQTDYYWHGILELRNPDGCMQEYFEVKDDRERDVFFYCYEFLFRHYEWRREGYYE